MKLKKLCTILFVAVLFSSCSTTIPNIEVCSPIEGVPNVSAICQNSNTDDSRELGLTDWFEFLYAQQERENKPAKGPAVCMSSIDYQKNDAAIAALCQKGRCTYSQKKAIERIRGMVKKMSPDIQFESLETIQEPSP